jgi:hypothetical protein
MSEYAETGEKLVQVKVIDDAGLQQGEAVMLTDGQIDELAAQLPEGWSTEEV